MEVYVSRDTMGMTVVNSCMERGRGREREREVLCERKRKESDKI